VNVRYDRLFWVLIAVILLSGATFLQKAFRQVVGSLTDMVHGLNRMVFSGPYTDVYRIGVLCVFLIALVGVVKAIAHRPVRSDDD
jgi:uncharacterized membrane protein